jgi:hypothetical protein
MLLAQGESVQIARHRKNYFNRSPPIYDHKIPNRFEVRVCRKIELQRAGTVRIHLIGSGINSRGYVPVSAHSAAGAAKVEEEGSFRLPCHLSRAFLDRLVSVD